MSLKDSCHYFYAIFGTLARRSKLEIFFTSISKGYSKKINPSLFSGSKRVERRDPISLGEASMVGSAAVSPNRQAVGYSILRFAARTTLPHFSSSSLMRAANSSGVLATGLKPSTASRSLNSGRATLVAISRESN
jgi:hypothetical protein